MQRKIKWKLPEVQLLKSAQVAEILGVTRMTISRYVRDGILPSPTKRGKGGSGYWKLTDVEVARRIRASRRDDDAA
jgi:predicted site-specific integrase-resolvase